MAGGRVSWSWKIGELAPYVQRIPALATYDLAPETYVFEDSLTYLGDFFHETMCPDATFERSFDGTCFVDGARYVYQQTAAARDAVTNLERGDLFVVSTAHILSKVEYPPGVCGPIGDVLSKKLDAFQVTVLKLVLGPAACHFPPDVVRELLGGVLPLSVRRDILRATFALALSAVSESNERGALLDLFRNETAVGFTRVSVSLAMESSITSLSLL